MSPIPRICLAVLALTGSGACFASERPSPDEVAKARGECRLLESRLERLERNANWCVDDPKLLQVRDAAEHSCGHAADLMIAAGLQPKPPQPQPQPAPPPPTLVITEKVRADSAAQTAAAEPAAQFAAMEADRHCEDRRSATP